MRELVGLGGFRNTRQDFDWEGAKLELDETCFEWGTVYEIEVETVRGISPFGVKDCCLVTTRMCGAYFLGEDYRMIGTRMLRPRGR